MFIDEKMKSFSWINIANPDHEDFEKLQTKYKIDEDTILDILDPDEQPRIESEDGYKVIIVRFPVINRGNDTVWYTEPLSVIYSDDNVITVSRRRCDILDKIKPSEKMSPEILILNIIYYITESYLKSLKELNKKVIESKKALQEKIRKKEILTLLDIENSYTLYTAGLSGNLAVADKLEKMRGFIKNADSEELIEDTRIELNQALSVITSYTKMLGAIKETFESVINIDSNTYINRLTVWNIVLIAPTIVVGYYGMNVKLPFAENMHIAAIIFASIALFLFGYGVYFLIKKTTN